MADSAEQISQTGALQVSSARIPQGREADYWELAAPASTFLDMEIDRANMYVAPLLITNGSEDRDGEVTNPNGLIDAAYRNDPVVFLQHSHRVAPMVPPVGTAETPDRTFDLHRRNDGWYSGCRFTQATKFAGQVFRLVDDGVLRGRSIGALNHQLSNYKPRLPGMAFVNNQIVPVRTKSVSHDKYELIEWSWVWMPANREIVTPRREITPQQEVVPVLKSILSRNKLDGLQLDPRLKLVLKSLNLAEPASNLQHAGQVRHWPFASKKVGDPIVETPYAILFSAKEFSVKDSKEFLAKSADLGVVETAIDSEIVDGQRFLKSVQFGWSGPTESVVSPNVPGLILLYAKAATTEVEQQVSGDGAEVDMEAAQSPAAEKSASPAEPAPEIVDQPADESEMEKRMQPGLRYLKALIKQATEVADKAEAAAAEQEPELLEKCKEFTDELRSYIGKVAEFQQQRYGKPDEATAGTGEEPVTAAIEKSLRVDLFYDRKAVVPKAIAKGLNVLHATASDDRQRQLTAAMLKGVISEDLTAKSEDPNKELRTRLEAALRKRVTSGLT